MNLMTDWFENSECVPPDGDVVLCSSIRMSRNIAGWKYFQRLTGKEVMALNLFQTKQMGKLPEFSFCGLDDISFHERQLLAEKNYITGSAVAGTGRYLAYELWKRPYVVFNEEDHIKIKCFRAGLDCLHSYEESKAVDRKLASVFDYQRDKKLGYKTASLDYCGTGVHAVATMFLPGLALDGKLSYLFTSATSSGISIRGYMDKPTGLPRGNMFLIENRLAADQDPDEMIHRLTDTFSGIAAKEREARQRVLERKRLDAVDIVMRSYGILRYCRRLNVWEALQILSDMKFGVNLGIIKMDVFEINRLFIKMQKYHLLADTVWEKKTLDVDRLRAEYIRNKLGLKEKNV
ncbi:MAG: hypothetical protein MJ215_04475 [Spirochaetia bacterium]|nr:hypothetical protein [Spirochaetia bacterium]